jgi:hypothetical protein
MSTDDGMRIDESDEQDMSAGDSIRESFDLLRMSNSKVPCTHKNTSRKVFQPMMECKSMKVMSKT